MRVEAIPYIGQVAFEQKTLTSESYLVDRVFAAYRHAVKDLVTYLKDSGYFVVSVVLGTYLLEPWSNFKASCLFLLGYNKNFQWYGLNPTRLTAEQAQKRPLLLLHGNYHNQSAWIMLAKALQESHGGPIYTVNLYSGDFNAKDREIIEAKIKEIKKQYREQGVDDIKIDLMGHSRGATMAFYSALENKCWEIDAEGGIGVIAKEARFRRDIGKVIRLGTPLTDYQSQWLDRETRMRMYEIDGAYDCLVHERSKADAEHKAEIPCGHLALLFHPETATAVQKIRN